jgi:hypothetical protein
LPSSVTGPRDFAPLAREASILREELISWRLLQALLGSLGRVRRKLLIIWVKDLSLGTLRTQVNQPGFIGSVITALLA